MGDKLRELILWRHAKSDWSDDALADHERPLSERGRRNAKKMAAWIEEQNLQPDLILCSSAKRTQQTLKRLCKECDTRIEIIEELYMADVPVLLKHLAQAAPDAHRVMVLAHNPGLEDLVEYLQGETVTRSPDVKLFPTAALAQFIMPADWSQLEKGDGKLVAITRPKDLPA
jgi:phosphohistidine phosphatase